MRLVLVVGLMAACGADATPPVDDGDAETAGAQPMTGEAPSRAGLYSTRDEAHQDGDLVALELTTSSAYIRARCYHEGCTTVVPETDRFDRYTSASGLTYLRFWSFTTSHDAGGALDVTPVVADVYETRDTAIGVELRKSHTTRWIQLAASTAEAVCGGGAWDGTACACPAHQLFVAGAGGCIPVPGASEDRCDDSSGLWTDDDATPIGSYCECGEGRRVADDGACVEI